MQDYQETYQNFRQEIPPFFNFSRDVFDAWAEDPEKIALWWIDDEGNEEKRTFSELSQESRRLSNLLAEQGVGKGDVVVVLLPRLIEWWLANLACIRMGAVISPGTVQLRAKDIQYRLEVSQTKCVIASPEMVPEVDQALSEGSTVGSKILVGGKSPGWVSYEEAVPSQSDNFAAVQTRSDDPCLVYFTSGTTGHPKMTLHTQVSCPLGHWTTGAFWLELKEEDLHWNLSDTGWAKAAYSSIFGPWNLGATIFIHHAVGFSPSRSLEVLAKYPITTFCAAPTIYRMLVLEDLKKYQFSTLRHCVAAGEPLNPEVIEVWKQATGLTIRDGYGQTESVILAASYSCLESRPGSMGKSAPGFDVQILDENLEIAPVDQEGEIAVRVRPDRPVGLFKEYWKDPEKTTQAFQGDWYLTGDRAYRDKDGYLWFVGRDDDVILSGAYRIGPFEVESALLEHPAVAESAVVSSPDPVRGAVVKAFVVLKEGFSSSEEIVRELQDHVKTTTAPYKYPRKIEFVEDLPKTVSGKIRRIELRSKEWESA